MKNLRIIFAIILFCILFTSCGGMLGIQKEVHIPARVPNGWQGVHFK